MAEARGHPGQSVTEYIGKSCARIEPCAARFSGDVDASSCTRPWVEQWLSAPRSQTYLVEAGGDGQRAVDLYEWNTAMTAAILHDLAHAELAVRNAYDAALVAYQPGPLHWTDDVMRRLPGRTANGQERPSLRRERDAALHHGFVTGTSRSAVDGPMSRLHRLRNRVAHHEPLLTQNLTARRGDVSSPLDCISPDLQALRGVQPTWAAVETQRP